MTDLMKNDEIDLDAWLNGGQRTERSVTLYARGDLLADIDLLLEEQRTEAAIADDDKSASDGARGRRLQEQIDALMIQLDASKLVVRVSTLVPEEREELRKQAKADMKKELDTVAAEAREDADLQCRRAGRLPANDVNSIVRNAAVAAVEATLDREVNFMTIAKAVVSPPMSVEQVKRLYLVIGEAQVGLLSKAYTRASIETPQVQVPKSQTPSPSDDGGTSS
jgi:hypothetical protein